jgi:predicted ATPase/DNA-binding SARP family transcriptional activator
MMHAEPRWYFRLFGGFEARWGAVCVHRLRTAKTTALMGYMVAHPPHRFTRESLCARFWDDREPERARNSLSVALNAIRHAFHLDEASAPLLECDAQTVALNPDLFAADVLAFEEAIALAQRTSDPSAQRHHYAHAASLYHGEFMAGYYEPWIIDKSAQLQLRYVHALRQLVELDLQRGERVSAIEWLQRLVSAQPYDPDPLYALTMLYLEEGLDAAARQLCEAWQAQYVRECGRAVPDKARVALLHCQRSRGVRRRRERQATPARPDKPERNAPPALPVFVAPAESALPTPAVPLLGREQELESLLRALRQPDTRCLTLLGLGGMGKTRLALEVAHRWAQHAPVCWTPLATLTHAEQLPEAALLALGVAPENEPLPQLLHCLRQRGTLLLVLDNLEHLLPDAARLIARLLQDAPECRLLSTSRAPIGIDGETLVALAPLPCDDTLASPAVQLFVHRARQVAHDFRITDENLPIIGALCRRLDGVPLAIELAASRVNVLSPRQMLDSVAHRLEWLKTHRVDIPPRHREMRSVLDVSYVTLPAAAQTLLRQLAASPGAWTLATLHAVFYPDAPLEPVADALETLLGAGLAMRLPNGDAPKFHLLEVVREYAQTLQAPDEAHAYRRAISDWVQAQAATRAAQSHTAQLPDWLAFWDDHKELLRETLEFLHEQGQTGALLTLFEQIARYLVLRPAASWAHESLARAVQAADAPPDALCRAMCLLARLHFHLESFEASRAWARRALALAESPDAPVDDATRGWALYWTVQLAFTARAMDTVNAHWERLWAYYPCPHEPRLHLAIHYLAGYLFPERHTAEWREQAVQFAHAQGDPLLLLDAIDALLEPLYFRGEYERARAYLREAETLARQLGSQTRLLPMLYTRAYIDIQQGALDSAESLIAELYALDAQLGRHAESIQWLHGMLYRHQGRYADALRLALELTAQHEMAQRPHEAASAWDLAATVALEMGDLTAARRYAQHALDQRARQDDAYRLHYSRTIYYGIRGMTAPDAEAINGLHACLRFWESQDLPPWRANTLYYLAAALAIAGETARAHDALDAAIHLNDAMGRRIALERCRALKKTIQARGCPETKQK